MNRGIACLLAAGVFSCRTGGDVQPIVIDLSSAKTPAATQTPTPTAPSSASVVPPVAIRTPGTVPDRPGAFPDSAERVVQGQLDAYNRHDLEGFVAFYAPDSKLFDGMDRITESGLDQIRRRYSRRFSESPAVRAAVFARIAHGSFVVDQEDLTGLGDGRTLSSIVVYEVRDGRIARTWFLR